MIDRRTEKFVKKILGENDIEAVLQRLDRLTLDEARATGAQTLEVVYGLVQHRRVVLDGERPVSTIFVACRRIIMPLDLDDKASVDDIQLALGQFFRRESKRLPDLPVERLHKVSSDLNKSRRELFLDGTATGYEC